MSQSLCHGSAAAGARIHWHPAGRHEPHSGVATRCLQQLQLWLSRHRQRRALAGLATMDGRLLRDIGVSLRDARREAAKPFWRE